MSRLRIISSLLWRELKEMKRDRKLIVTTLIIPLLSLPAIGVLTYLLLYYQPVVIAIVNSDQGGVYSNWFVDQLGNILRSKWHIVHVIDDLDRAIRDINVDLIVNIPEGFSSNLTSFRDIAYVKIMKRTGVSGERIDRAEQDVREAISTLSTAFSNWKIKMLADQAGVEVNVDAVRNPVQVWYPVFIGPTGEPAEPEDLITPFIARLLILSFTFIVTPASTYIVDGIVGERERKTFEILVSTPAGLTNILISKIIASSLIGLIASIADLLGLFIYFYLLIYALGEWFSAFFNIGLIIVHVVTAFFSILVTVAISLPFITRTRGIKTASNISSLLSLLGLAFFMTGWIVDFYKMPSEILGYLKLVPYTHSVLAVQSYVYKDYVSTIFSVVTLAALSVMFLVISLRVLDREKVLLAQ